MIMKYNNNNNKINTKIIFFLPYISELVRDYEAAHHQIMRT